MSEKPPMWTCPDCHRQFARTRQLHNCAAPSDLEGHFAKADPVVRATFDEFLAAVRQLGPVEVVPQATRIALHARMSFAAFMPRRHWLAGHLVLAEPVDDPHFTKISSYSRRNHVHEFRLHRPEEIDESMRRWIAAAYQVGIQNHHRSP